MTCKQCTAYRAWRKALERDLLRMARRWDEHGYVNAARELRQRLSLGARPAPTAWQEKLRGETEEP